MDKRLKSIQPKMLVSMKRGNAEPNIKNKICLKRKQKMGFLTFLFEENKKLSMKGKKEVEIDFYNMPKELSEAFWEIINIINSRMIFCPLVDEYLRGRQLFILSDTIDFYNELLSYKRKCIDKEDKEAYKKGLEKLHTLIININLRGD